SRTAHREAGTPGSPDVSVLTRLPCKFCPLCRIEDIERFGSPYWHREHQVAGAYLCLRHDSPLRLCAPDAMETQPTPFDVDSVDVPAGLLEACMSPVIKRYHDLCARLLSPGRSQGSWPRVTNTVSRL